MKKLKDVIGKFLGSKVVKKISGFVGAVIIVLSVFMLGMNVGFHKAEFSYQWGENYHKNFAGPKNGFLDGFEDKEFLEAHGTMGQIIKIDGTTLLLKSPDDTEKIVLLKEDTVIKKFKDTVKSLNLKIDDHMVVIGTPNSAGQIEAKFIRLLPPPPRDLKDFQEKEQLPHPF